ncbi:MAG: DnaJ domain-containing protein [Nitrospirae bacterium]|nr:DnaJ domain-containing protein [Nitrospirota bacterium]
MTFTRASLYNISMHTEEKRYFKRYEVQSDCKVRLGTETYKGRIVNYSDGIGAVFENAPQLALGKQVDIKVFDPEMEFKGEVVWVEKSGDEVWVGFRRLDSLQGSLKSFALADVLIGLQRSTRTGILKVESGSIVKEIFIKNGDMIFAISNKKEDRLSDFLLKQGKISQEEYNQTESLLKKSGGKLGKIFVELGILKPKELFFAVRQQTEEIILSLFAIEDGSFKFMERSLPQEELITLQISAANIIYRGIKRINNVLRIKQASPAPEAVLALSPSPLNIFQDVVIDEPDKIILSCIDGKRSLKMILPLLPFSDSDTLRSICALLNIGMIIVKREDMPPAELRVKEIISEPVEEITTEFIEKMEDIFNKCETLGYYEMLRVEKDASAEEIVKAYYKASKEFHPDRRFSLPSEDLSEGLKEKLTKVFFYITKAYEVLSDPEKRAEYDMTLSLRAVEQVKEIAADVSPSEEETIEEVVSKDEEEPYIEEPKEMSVGIGAAVTESREEIFKGEIPEEIKTAAQDEGAEIAIKQTPDMKPGKLRDEELQLDRGQTALNEIINKAERRGKKSRAYMSAAIFLAVVLVVAMAITFNHFRKKPTTTAPTTLELSKQLQAQKVPDVSNKLSIEKEAARLKQEKEAAKLKQQEEAAELKKQQATDKLASLARSVKAAPEPLSRKFMRTEEQFDNNANNWEIFNITMASARIEGGKYYIENKRETGVYIILHHADFPSVNDFIIETSIKTEKASGNYSYGFVLGASDANNSYVFQFIANEFYSIKRYNKGVSQELAGGKIGSTVINKNSFNTLKVEKHGSTIRFYINDYYVAEVSNISLFGKKIGFFIEGLSEISVDYTRSQIWPD